MINCKDDVERIRRELEESSSDLLNEDVGSLCQSS